MGFPVGSFNFIQILIEPSESNHMRPWSDATFCSVWFESALFVYVRQKDAMLIWVKTYEKQTYVCKCWYIVTLSQWFIKSLGLQFEHARAPIWFWWDSSQKLTLSSSPFKSSSTNSIADFSFSHCRNVRAMPAFVGVSVSWPSGTNQRLMFTRGYPLFTETW